jgi:hypothetical protein
MKKNLLLIPFGFLTLLYSLPISAKSIWLECGKYKFNLNENKREYSTTLLNKVVQGNAVFFPSQIDFSVPLVTYDNEGSGIRYDYSINRKTLEYQIKVMSRSVISTSFSYSDTGWVQQKGDHSLTIGTCKIIKNPTESNKI